MKQEYTDKMRYFQEDEYEAFLKEKCVLDAKQYLISSMMHLNYALITAKLYYDVGKRNIEESSKNQFYNIVEVLDWNYDVCILLNKLTFEWISHISNSLDCFLQYLNAALHLELSPQSVGEGEVLAKLQKKKLSLSTVKTAMVNLWEDDTVKYICEVNNFTKHTCALFGSSSFLDVMIYEKRDIIIPAFKFRGVVYNQKKASDLFNYYETFLGKYIKLIDEVNSVVTNAPPISNRYHITKMMISGNPLGEKKDSTDLVINAEWETDGIHIKRYWLENFSPVTQGYNEIMYLSKNPSRQYLDFIHQIDIVKDGNKIGELKAVVENEFKQKSKQHEQGETSVLAYIKYRYTPTP